MADGTKPACGCARCRMRALMGPILLITIGVIFLLGRFTPYGFEQLWPVILLVAGGVLLAQSSASGSGHMGN
jgi:cell wall-active antibiotic response 4TMS protein YvqF